VYDTCDTYAVTVTCCWSKALGSHSFTPTTLCDKQLLIVAIALSKFAILTAGFVSLMSAIISTVNNYQQSRGAQIFGSSEK
jgi:hypothetical protein